jgi:mycothiol synthase
MSLTITTWDESRLEETVSVLNAASRLDQFQLAHVREAVFSDIDYDPDLLLGARSGDETVAVAAGVVRRPPNTVGQATPVGYLKLLAVAPGRQGQGIGSALLAAVEDRLTRAGATAMRVFGDAPFYLRPGVDFRLTRLVCLLQRRGYRFRGHAVNMDVDLGQTNLDTAEDEARLSGIGIAVRRLEAGDATRFREYMERDWSWGWTIEASRSLGRVPISTHVAEQNGEIVGFATHSASGPGQFGPMGVKPELRRHGLGAVLLRRCLADLRAQGYASAEIQWVGPIGFYARHVGASLSRCFWQFEKSVDG